jgi:hypothetical protein
LADKTPALSSDPEKPCSLAVLLADTGQIREVTSASLAQWFQNIAWRPERRHLLFTEHYSEGSRESTGVELWRVAGESGEEEDLGFSFQGIWDLAVHPDGTRTAFTYMRHISEIWAMENLVTGSAE